MTCILGPGDSTKTSLLDAIELTLTPRWPGFTDVDFTNSDTSTPIEIVVTVGQLPAELLRENRLGMHLRGWTGEGAIRDEPATDDEPVISVRLRVDSTLEPNWEAITDRGEPRAVSPRDRALFGVVRLGGDPERHLTWGQGSALSHLGGNRDDAAPVLAEAYRTARDLLRTGTIPALDIVAQRVRAESLALGAYADGAYSAGLDTQRLSMNLGSLAIHDSGTPLRLAGLGTRRLVALAVQQMSTPEGAIILVDELEHGLEPHRIRYALKRIRDSHSGASASGQVLLTTHSATTVVELKCNQLAVCRRNAGNVQLASPSDTLQAVVRRVPEALLSRAVVVCEGKTEVGVLRGLRDLWSSQHNGVPAESRGITFADGGGSQAASTACELGRLGYAVALLRDSDVPLSDAETTALAAVSATVIEWPGTVSTEERLSLDLSHVGVQQLLALAIGAHGRESVLDSIRHALGTTEPLGEEFSGWSVSGKSDTDFRRAVGTVAKKQGWFKNVDFGESLGQLIATEIVTSDQSLMAVTISSVETWTYGH